MERERRGGREGLEGELLRFSFMEVIFQPSKAYIDERLTVCVMWAPSPSVIPASTQKIILS